MPGLWKIWVTCRFWFGWDGVVVGVWFCFSVSTTHPSQAFEWWKKGWGEAWRQHLRAWVGLNWPNIVVIVCTVTDQLGRVQGTAKYLWSFFFLEQCSPLPGSQQTTALLSKLTFSLARNISYANHRRGCLNMYRTIEAEHCAVATLYSSKETTASKVGLGIKSLPIRQS